MLNKQYTAEFKALTPSEDAGAKAGDFEAIVAVYDNVDRQGDRIKAGAFDETLEAWRASGDPIPIVLAHGWDDPFKHIGYADPQNVKSIPGKGLYAKGHLDIDDNPLAKQVHRLMERRTLKEFSFGYRIPEGGERKAQDGAYDLLAIDLIEFGPCLKGVNEETELLAIKSELESESRRERGEEPTIDERFKSLERQVADVLERLDGDSGGKAYAELRGTFEARMQSIREALDAEYAGEKSFVSIEGTTADTVTFCVYDMESSERKTFQAPYELGEDDAVSVGSATEVEIEAVVKPKSDEQPDPIVDAAKMDRDRAEEEAYEEKAQREAEEADRDRIKSDDILLEQYKQGLANFDASPLGRHLAATDPDIDDARRRLDDIDV